MRLLRVWAPIVLASGLAPLSAQTTIDLRTQAKSVDFSSASYTKPFKAGPVLPATCSVSETFFHTAAPAGQNLYGCTAANTWTLLTPSGLADPGASGLVVESTPGVTTNRTIAAGSANISVVNGGGAGGNPTIDIGQIVDFSGKATSPAQVGASLPATCTAGQIYFHTGAIAGQNLYLCTTANVWSQVRGAVPTVFGRSGAVTAQSGDYNYSQIAGAPGSLPPNGPASGDLTGSYPSPTVWQVNGAPIPASGLLKANASQQIVQATAADLVNLFGGCSGTQYLGADGVCHAAASGGSVALTTGSGPPSGNCVAPSGSNLAVYLDTANGDEWWCYAANAWKKTLSVTGSGPYQVTGATGPAPGAATSGTVECYFDSTSNTQVCLDSNGNAFTMVKGLAAAAHQFLTNIDGSGIQHAAQPAFSDVTGTVSAAQIPNVPVQISTSGPVSDPGGANYYLYNNASGAMTFQLPAGAAGMQRCYRNATGKSGAITIAVAAGNAIDLNGSNGTTGTGTLVSNGALGDAVCLVSDSANHWYAYIEEGAWSNN